jgi:hypothetical protein
MDDAEIKRLRKEIHRTYGSSPHKKKYWLALLEMHGRRENDAEPGARWIEPQSEAVQAVARLGDADSSGKRLRDSGVGRSPGEFCD